jgi:hypothetical protein
MAIDEKIYEEIGANYRYFASWRHKAVVGVFVVLGAAVSLCISAKKEAPELMWLIPAIASPVGILLWIIDLRIRDLYHAAIRAGKALESPLEGFYTVLARDVVVPKGKSILSRPTQSFALNILFIGSSLALLALSVWSYFKYGHPALALPLNPGSGP